MALINDFKAINLWAICGCSENIELFSSKFLWVSISIGPFSLKTLIMNLMLMRVSFGATVNLLLCHLKVIGSSCRTSLLRKIQRKAEYNKPSSFPTHK